MQESWLGIIRLFLRYHDLLVGITPDPCLVRWHRLGKTSISSNISARLLRIWEEKLTFQNDHWNQAGVNFTVIRKTVLCRSFFSFLLKYFSWYYWVTQEHCSVGWLPSSTRHLPQVEMHFKLKLTEHRPALGSKCQREAAQSGQNPKPSCSTHPSQHLSLPKCTQPVQHPQKLSRKLHHPRYSNVLYVRSCAGKQQLWKGSLLIEYKTPRTALLQQLIKSEQH